MTARAWLWFWCGAIAIALAFNVAGYYAGRFV